jgi:hypothetical protein
LTATTTLADLAATSLNAIRILEQPESRAVFASKLLDHHDAIQSRVTSFPDFAHSTRADKRQDLVRSEFIAGRQRHLH